MFEFHFVRNGNLIHEAVLKSPEVRRQFKKQLLIGLKSQNLKRDYEALCEAYIGDNVYLSLRRVKS